MDIFEIDPQALIILVIMIVGGLKWLIDRLKGEHLRRDDDEDGAPTTFQELYEEARREIQQRQGGRPAGDPRPASFEPLAKPPPLPPALPKVRTKPPAEPSPYLLKTSRAARRPVLTAAEKAAAQRMEEHGRGRKVQRRKAHRQGTGVRALLASPTAARDAIVLREILGPPRGTR